VRLKLNTIRSEFAGKNVLLVDDSIVRGTTSRELVQMARDAGAKAVYFASAAPEVRYPNVYGIDIPTRTELIANQRTPEDIAELIGCDWVCYQTIADLEATIKALNPAINTLDSSCFSGSYVTGDINEKYFEAQRTESSKRKAGDCGTPKQGGSGGGLSAEPALLPSPADGAAAAAAAAADAGAQSMPPPSNNGSSSCGALHNDDRKRLRGGNAGANSPFPI